MIISRYVYWHHKCALTEGSQREGFCYAHTPIITSSDCEGAGETFSVSSPQIGSEGSENHQQPDFFGRPAFLTVSSQLHLEALASSISRIYTISPCFRAEKSQTNRHLSEFWMLEAEWAFTKSVQEVCDVAEKSIQHVLDSSSDALLLRKNVDDSYQRMLKEASDPSKSWARMSYTDAVAELSKFHAAQRSFQFEPSWGKPLQSEHERWLADHLISGPVFITDYPKSLKPFYMRLNDDEQTVACFDLLVPTLGELIGGSLREERSRLLQEALDEHQLDRDAYNWYLDIRKFGGASHGGFGIGFERLIKWISGIENVRECIPMPRWVGKMLL